MVARNDVVIIDLTFLLKSSKRSFCGAPLIVDPQGVDNTVLYGVARGLLRLRNTVGIRHGIIVIGREANAVSNEASIDSVVRFLRRLRAIVIYEPKATVPSLCRSLSSAARWVLTQDRVLFQLVSEDFGVIVPDIAGSGSEVVTRESLKTTLGIRPAQVPSFLALAESGTETLFTKRQAIRLLEVHDDLGELLQDISAVSSREVRRKLLANEKLLLSRLCDMRLEEAVYQPTALAGSDLAFIEDDENSAGVLREYGFWSLARLLPRPMTTDVTASSRAKPDALLYKAIRTEAGMRELEALVSKSEVCAVDTEASDRDPRSASLFGVAFSVKAGEAFYVPVTDADLEGMSFELIKARLRKLFAGRTRFVGHNVKFDCVLLRRHGIAIKNVFFDTMLAAYECFGDWEFFNLGALAKKLLAKNIKRYRDIVGEGETLLDVPFNELLEHACTDADMTLRLYHRLEKELEKRKVLEQFSDQTMALLRVLADKECDGVRLNIRAVHRRKEVLAEEVEVLRRAVIAQAGKEFDLDSPTETASALCGISAFGAGPGQRVTLTQLEQLAGTHCLPRLIVKYRRVQKLVRQLETICAAVKKGRVFPMFSQIRWAHGGLSSMHPRICEPDGPIEATALIDRAIREHMDDSNRSLDILQRVSGDGVLKRDLRNGGDRPCFIGGAAAERDLDQNDLLLSVAIGLSDAALSSRFLIDRLTAAGIRQELEGKYAKLFKWLDIYRRDAITRGFAHHDGRRKYIEGLRSSDIDKRHKALRSAVRWLIQY
jgi:DNA polymerase I-like protein with 3'-5' exonuclease and polymerase domains